MEPTLILFLKGYIVSKFTCEVLVELVEMPLTEHKLQVVEVEEVPHSSLISYQVLLTSLLEIGESLVAQNMNTTISHVDVVVL